MESANHALVYVRRIVGDIVSTYRTLMELRDRRVEAGASTLPAVSPDTLREAMEDCVDQLNALGHELRAVGCELKDWGLGLVDFPAERDGRRIWLCWKLGEDRVAYWHERNEGFAGRKPLDAPGSTGQT